MTGQKCLNIHIGYRSAITLFCADRALQCCPGDLHALTARNVELLVRLLDLGAVSSTGQIRTSGHDLVAAVITIQNLPALQLEDGTVTSTDVRMIQKAKATVASAVHTLLEKAETAADAVKVNIETIDGSFPLAMAQRIGMLPRGMSAAESQWIAPALEPEVITLTEPATIHAYAENLLFPQA